MVEDRMIQDQTLPAEIGVAEFPGGVRYRLPPHDFGAFRWVGLLLMAFGLAPIGMAAAFLGFVLKVAGANQAAFFGLLCASPMLLLFLVIGCALAFFGVWILLGRSDIELSPKKVRAILRVGPLFLSRRCPRASVRQFTVVRPGASSRPSSTGASAIAWLRLQAECTGRKPLLLAAGYPRELLLALAADLSRRASLAAEPFADAPPAEPILVAEETDDPALVVERPRQPAESTAVLESFPDGVTITLPAAGMWRGSPRFWLVWTWLWCLLVVPISVAAVAGKVHNDLGQPIAAIWVLLFLVPFWLVAVGSMLTVVHRGRRQAVLAVAGGRLMILQTGLFGTKRQEWPREELRWVAAVVTENRDSEGGSTWTTHLVVEPSTGPAQQLLGHRTKQEVEWMATTLRRALGLPIKRLAGPL
jgi:hypothetical protein